jgi:hypothetical protein
MKISRRFAKEVATAFLPIIILPLVRKRIITAEQLTRATLQARRKGK